MSILEDTILILRFKQGSPEALCGIYLKYRRYLLKIAIALLHDMSDAEDAVQDVFLGLVKSAQTLRPSGSLKAYLRTCLVNRIRNKRRDDQVRSAVDLGQAGTLASVQQSSQQWVILAEEAVRISNALARIPFEQREVIVLHLYGEMTFRQIARLQDVSMKTIQSRYRYGLDKLRPLFESEVEK